MPARAWAHLSGLAWRAAGRAGGLAWAGWAGLTVWRRRPSPQAGAEVHNYPLTVNFLTNHKPSQALDRLRGLV